ncbi:unnamed protein product [Arctogadus glacialis]
MGSRGWRRAGAGGNGKKVAAFRSIGAGAEENHPGHADAWWVPNSLHGIIWRAPTSACSTHPRKPHMPPLPLSPSHADHMQVKGGEGGPSGSI